MPRIRIDGRDIEIQNGDTVLAAARRAGISIPSMCFSERLGHFASCLVCLVEDNKTKRLIPSCAAPARDGMDVATATDRVTAARRASLELLLSEHIGDCEGPCRKACPARVDIPRILRLVGAGRAADALPLLRESTALPATICRICPASCERACRRGQVDAGVAIRLVHLFLPTVIPAPVAASSGKRIAIVGAGPAGLSAAFHLLSAGHGCVLFDANEFPGGMLRYGVPEDRLPRDILDADIDAIRRMGAEFRMNTALGEKISLAELERGFDAVVLATGHLEPKALARAGIAAADAVRADPATFATPNPRIFAGGDLLRAARMAARGVFHGRAIAASLDQLFRNRPVTGLPAKFNSLVGKPLPGELEELMKGVDAAARTAPANASGVFTAAEAVRESARCMHCDCRKADDCRLRELATACDARQPRYKADARPKLEKNLEHPAIIFEPGKCIRCGLCVRLTGTEHERLGMAFLGRGYAMRIGVPFGEPLAHGLEATAEDCVKICPTGALTFRSAEF
ncbi:MAG: 2Fe-2S iron-sulfur cluster-binding protein [Planctomycetota bacterium]